MGNDSSTEKEAYCNCGRSVSPGKTFNGNPYQTCCKPCAVNKFTIIDDQHSKQCQERCTSQQFEWHEEWKRKSVGGGSTRGNSNFDLGNSNHIAYAQIIQELGNDNVKVKDDDKDDIGSDDSKFEVDIGTLIDEWDQYLCAVPGKYHNYVKDYYRKCSGKGQFRDDICWLSDITGINTNVRTEYRYGKYMKTTAAEYPDNTDISMVYALKNIGNKDVEFVIWNDQKNSFVYTYLKPGEWEYVGESECGFKNGIVVRNHYNDGGWKAHSTIKFYNEENIDCNSYSPRAVMLAHGGFDWYEMELMWYTTNKNIPSTSVRKIENVWIKKHKTLNGMIKDDECLSFKINLYSAYGLAKDEFNTIDNGRKMVLKRMVKRNILGQQSMHRLKIGDEFNLCKICWDGRVLHILTEEEIKFAANNKHQNYEGNEDAAFFDLTSWHISNIKYPDHNIERYVSVDGNFSSSSQLDMVISLDARTNSWSQITRSFLFGTLQVKDKYFIRLTKHK
eukprot:138713_1